MSRFVALGGGDRVGGSCYLFETALKSGRIVKIVVDCGTGFDTNPAIRSKHLISVLPDLAPIDGVKIDFLFLTHGHTDHCGALPVFVRRHPEACIFMTEPTALIITQQFFDAIKIYKEDRVGEAKLFGKEDVEHFFTRPPDENAGQFIPENDDPERLVTRVWNLGPMDWQKPYPEDPEFQFALWPSGHIRGAASILIKTHTQNIMFSGDVSTHDAPTVCGAVPPPDFKPDVLITENTYGGRVSKPRDNERQRFITKVEEVIGRGGNVLIPAFALGRAADVALLLSEAGIDTWLVGGLPQRMFNIGNRHGWCDADVSYSNTSGIHFAKYCDIDRLTMLRGQVFVASSGMLDAGPSHKLAARLIDDVNNAILFSGFLAPNSLGRRVRGMNKGERVKFEFEERVDGGIRAWTEEKPLEAEIDFFSCFSAHADQRELADWILKLAPKEIIGIHGDAAGFHALEQVLHNRGFAGRTRLGETGISLEV